MVLQVENPVLECELSFVSLFVCRSQIEMRVGVIRLDFDGAAQMPDGFFEFADFVQDAAEIEMADGVFGIERQRGVERFAGIFQFTLLKKNAPDINVRLAPRGLHFNHAPVKPHGFIDRAGTGFAFQRVLKNFFRRSRVHLANICRSRLNVKGEKKLSGEGFNGVAGAAGRNRGDLPAACKQLQFADGNLVFAGTVLKEGDGAAQLFRGNFSFGDCFDGTQGDEIAEIIEALSPARLRHDEAEPVPVA